MHICELYVLQVLALASLAQVLVRVQLAHSVQIELKSVTSVICMEQYSNEAVLLTKPHVSVEN